MDYDIWLELNNDTLYFRLYISTLYLFNSIINQYSFKYSKQHDLDMQLNLSLSRSLLYKQMYIENKSIH